MTPEGHSEWWAAEVRVVAVPRGEFWRARAEARWGATTAESRDRDRAVRYALADLAALATEGRP